MKAKEKKRETRAHQESVLAELVLSHSTALLSLQLVVVGTTQAEPSIPTKSNVYTQLSLDTLNYL